MRAVLTSSIKNKMDELYQLNSRNDFGHVVRSWTLGSILFL